MPAEQPRRPAIDDANTNTNNFNTNFINNFDNEIDTDSTTLPPNIRFIRPTLPPSERERCSNPFKCPPKTFAGGRKPRVKSNIKARKRNYWNPRNSRARTIRKQKKKKQSSVRISPQFRDTILGHRRGRTGRKQEDNDNDRKNEIASNEINDNDLRGGNRGKSVFNSLTNSVASIGTTERSLLNEITVVVPSSTTTNPLISLQRIGKHFFRIIDTLPFSKMKMIIFEAKCFFLHFLNISK